MTIKWKESWSIGIKTFDDQHKELIILISKLEDEGLFGDKAGDILDELIKYSRYHFDEEEKSLELHGYTDLRAHRKHHQQLLDEVTKIRKLHKKSGRFDANPKDFLLKWLIMHTQNEDSLYANFLRKKGIS